MEVAHSQHVDGQVKHQNVAGNSTRVMAQGRRAFGLWLIFSSLLCLTLFFCANLLNSRTRSIWVALGCLAGIVVIGRGVIPLTDFLKKREEDASRGAEAEEAVGAILDRLPDNYMVLHAITRPCCGDIDHVLLRKDGAVFVIETKSMRGRVTERNGQLLINGYAPHKNFVGQTLRNAVWLRDVLRAELGVVPWVDAGLVFTRASLCVRNDREDIQVMKLSSLVEWMAKSPPKREVGRRARLKWKKLRELLRSQECATVTPVDSQRFSATDVCKPIREIAHHTNLTESPGSTPTTRGEKLAFLAIFRQGLWLVAALLLASCSKPDVIVLDTAGKPVQGARVLGASLSTSGQATFTDKWGKAPIPRAVQETKWLSIYKHGYIPVENISVAQKKPIVIRITRVPGS